MKTSYEHLTAMCALPPDFNAFSPQPDPRNVRVQYLLNALAEMGAIHDIDCFDATGDDSKEKGIPRFVNIIAAVPAGNLVSTESVVFLAHHDVRVPEYQNANDNTASCCNLLELLERLMADVPLNRRTYIVFTDAEEIVSYTQSGSSRLARLIKQGGLGDVKHCINLELTGFGRALYCDHKIPGLAEAAGVSVPVVHTPFSDATILRHWGVPATVLGTLPYQELDSLRNRRIGCPTWARCHQPSDSLALISAPDMARFVRILERIAHGEDG